MGDHLVEGGGQWEWEEMFSPPLPCPWQLRAAQQQDSPALKVTCTVHSRKGADLRISDPSSLSLAQSRCWENAGHGKHLNATSTGSMILNHHSCDNYPRLIFMGSTWFMLN